MNDVCAIILAAGDGKRMRSALPKVLCQVLFKPMLCWVTDLCKQSGMENLCLVVGNQAQQLSDYIPAGAVTVLQKERLGTGHAVMMAKDFISQHKDADVVVLYGDAPFIDKETLLGSLSAHQQSGAVMTVITADLPKPYGYGRIVREGDAISCIVEEADATPQQKEIHEINSGTYWFKAGFLLEHLDELSPQNAQGEYYLTDLAKIAVQHALKVIPYKAACPQVVLGANDRAGLLALNEAARHKVMDRLLSQGVEILSRDGVVISPDVQIGADTVIYPGTILKGRVEIGSGCVIGPNTLIEDSVIGDGCTVNSSQIYQSQVGDGVRIGPFSHLRPHSCLASRVKIGNFVEVKNSTIGEKTSVAHLTYIGDSDLGKEVNMGCGCVTVNYDGINKYRTTIEDHAFIGCNTNLIAPVTVKEGAFTAAGSTITDDVPKDALAIARARQSVKEGWAERFRRLTKKIPR